MLCGTDVSREVVREEPGPGTGESIYTTSSGSRFRYWCGRLPPGCHWKQTASANTSQMITATYTNVKTQKEIELEKLLRELAEWYRAERNRTWIKPLHDKPVYRPRFRRVRHLKKPENRARSNPVHVRNIKWDPRERA